MPGTAEVSWAELALYYEPFEPSLPGPPAAGYAPAAGGRSPNPPQGGGPGGTPPCGGHAAERGPVGALPLTPPLGGPRVRGTFGPPVLRGTPRGDVAAYAHGDPLPGLVGPAPASACPHAAAAGRPLPYGLFPTSPRGGAPCAPVCREAPAGAAQKCPARSPAAQPPAGGGQWHTGRALLGGCGAVVRQVHKPRLGHQPLLPDSLRRPHWPLGGPMLSECPGPGRAKTPSARPSGPARRGGCIVLLAGAGLPGLPSPPELRRPSGTLVHGTTQNVGYPPLHSIGARRPQAHKAPDA